MSAKRGFTVVVSLVYEIVDRRHVDVGELRSNEDCSHDLGAILFPSTPTAAGCDIIILDLTEDIFSLSGSEKQTVKESEK